MRPPHDPTEWDVAADGYRPPEPIAVLPGESGPVRQEQAPGWGTLPE